MPIRVAVVKDPLLVLEAVVRGLDGLLAKTVCKYLAGVYHKLGSGVEEGVNPRVAAINKARELDLLREES